MLTITFLLDEMAIVHGYAGQTTPFFFFQAEDGIRDRDVTGVQTCALPIYGLEELVRRRVLHLTESIARVAVTDSRADERLRVPARHNDGTKLDFARQCPGELDAPGRAVVSAVEQPDERSAIQLLPTDEFPSQFEEGIDIVHPERADERVDARMVPPFEELHGPVIRS